MAVEALAAGTPVIAFKAGGALDYVEPGKTGAFFEEQTVESLSSALTRFSKGDFSNSTIQAYADKFSTKEFSNNISRQINKYLV